MENLTATAATATAIVPQTDQINTLLGSLFDLPLMENTDNSLCNLKRKREAEEEEVQEVQLSSKKRLLTWSKSKEKIQELISKIVAMCKSAMELFSKMRDEMRKTLEKEVKQILRRVNHILERVNGSSQEYSNLLSDIAKDSLHNECGQELKSLDKLTQEIKASILMQVNQLGDQIPSSNPATPLTTLTLPTPPNSPALTFEEELRQWEEKVEKEEQVAGDLDGDGDC
jgi:cell division septum initiation protein DivIVA